MSPRPLRPCLQPGCTLLVAKGRCPTHSRQYERYRGSAAKRGYGPRHQHWRKLVLGREPLCRDCGKPATDADHIIPLSMGGTWELENGAGRCHRCHSRKTARELRDPFLGIRMREAQ